MRARIITATLAAALAVAAAGCGESESDPATATADKSSRADVSKGVVAIEGIYPDKTTKVSGVVFEAKRGLVLTANHAIEAAPNINVTLGDGTVTHGVSVARAQCHDLAVVKLNPKPTELTAIPLADSTGAAIGQPVTTVGYQFQSENERRPALSKVQGTISGTNVTAKFSPLPSTGPFIAHETTLVKGAAGSPLVDARGRMIGLNTFVEHPRTPNLPGIEYALTSSYIRGRMRELRRGKGGALGGWEAEHDACHASLAKLLGKGHLSDPGVAHGT